MSNAESSTSHALSLGPRARGSKSHPLTSFGRHFGRTVWAFCSMRTLFSEGIHRLAAEQLGEILPELTPEKRCSYLIFKEVVRMQPKVFDKLGSEDSTITDLFAVAQYMQDGINGARSDDIKGLKAAVVDWLAPPGQYLNPMIRRNDKSGRGFNHEVTGRLLCPVDLNWNDPQTKEQLQNGTLLPAADQWPLFLYQDYTYDPEQPWNGLLRSDILVKAFKFVFTSPSSVEKEPRATRMGNAKLHGMDRTTPASIAYIATLLQFSLCSAAVFNRSDSVTDSENFYCSLMDLLEDPEEAEEVKDLLRFWNHAAFRLSSAKKHASQKSALAAIRNKRTALKSRTNIDHTSATTSSTSQTDSARSGATSS